MCYRHFHKSNVKKCDENNFTIKLNSVPTLHLTKDTVLLESTGNECTEASRTFGMEDEIALLEKDSDTNNNWVEHKFIIIPTSTTSFISKKKTK